VISDPNLDTLLEALAQAQEHEDQFGDAPVFETCRVYHQDGLIKQIHLPPWPDLDLPWIEQPADMLERIDSAIHRVANNKLITLDLRPQKVLNLQRSNNGQYRTVKGYASLLLEPDEDWNEIDQYQDRTD
jgi:hypothetical protein